MFLPENIDLAHSEKYNLSIRLTPNGFSFCIHCPTDPSVFHFQKTTLGNTLSYTENVQKVIFDLGFFSQSFRKTTVMTVSPHYTLVPDVFFDKKRAKELFDFSIHNFSGAILADTVRNGACYALFGMEEEVHSFLSRHLWNPGFTHHISSLLNFFGDYAPDDTRKKCFVDFHDENASVLCFSGNKLLSANTFSAKHPHDTAYFIASVWEKQQFDQTSDVLYASGDAHLQKTPLEILRKLIRYVQNVELSPKISVPENQIKDIPTDILATLCV